MRDLIITENVTLDGVAETQEDWFSTAPDDVLSGSLTLARALLAEGLVDEYRLFVYPVVRGHGRRLFEPDADLRRMRLEENRATSSGVVLLRYRMP